MTKILVLNGPNLNFLGIREVDVYGREDYDSLRQLIAKKGASENILVECFQSNYEGAIIDKIQESFFDGITQGIVINPGAYAHYSYAIRDALASVPTLKVEVHISDIKERAESWRHTTVTAEACDLLITGHGFNGYLEAIDYLLEKIQKNG
ncbi:MAG: 3-dehydroquinate dehydratase [Fibrobacter sp.]|nr:3-dehydroquinate dehydratase [Fibrobacter sp.]